MFFSHVCSLIPKMGLFAHEVTPLKFSRYSKKLLKFVTLCQCWLWVGVMLGPVWDFTPRDSLVGCKNWVICSIWFALNIFNTGAESNVISKYSQSTMNHTQAYKVGKDLRNISLVKDRVIHLTLCFQKNLSSTKIFRAHILKINFEPWEKILLCSLQYHTNYANYLIIFTYKTHYNSCNKSLALLSLVLMFKFQNPLQLKIFLIWPYAMLILFTS